MTDAGRSYHPASGDLYTPVTDEVVALLDRMKEKHRYWRDVSAISETRLRVLMRIRKRERPTISMSLMDRLITTTGVGSLSDFTWFTADDLVALGLWEKPADPVFGSTGKRTPIRRKKVS